MTTTTQGSSTTYYVNNYYEVTDGVVTKYYYAGAQRIAMRKGGTLTYILGDHLGSTSIVTDATGNVISDTKYKAWGEERYSSGTKQTPYSFTGQYGHQAEFGLIHYGARMYDPSLSRFTSADIIVPAGVQGLDRYAYVNNSPLNYTDPTGHYACGDGEILDCNGRQHSLARITPTQPGSDPAYGNRLIGPSEFVLTAPPTSTNSYGNITFPTPSDICRRLMVGAPLFCNVETVHSSANYFQSLLDEAALEAHPLSYFSMLADISNIRGWTEVKIPGVVGMSADFLVQKSLDANMGLSPAEANTRALIAVTEGQVISYASSLASGASALGAIETGPGVVFVVAGAYVASSLALSSIADSWNSQFIFPAIHELTQP